MFNFLLSIVATAPKNNSYYWLLAASLPPLLYFFGKKQKLSWLQRILIRRNEKRARNGKKMVSDSDKTTIGVFIALGLIGMIVGLLVKSGGVTIFSFCVLVCGLGWLLASKHSH